MKTFCLLIALAMLAVTGCRSTNENYNNTSSQYPNPTVTNGAATQSSPGYMNGAPVP